jgi:noranthrone synthase
VLKSAVDKGVRQRGGKTATTTKAEPKRPDVQPKPAKVPSRPVITSAPASAPVTASKAQVANDEKFKAALKVISEESGIALEELVDDSNFADMGIDSLSSMVIGSRLREDLGMDLSPDFSLFTDCPTIHALQRYMCGPSESASGGDGGEQFTTQSAPVAVPEAHRPSPGVEYTIPNAQNDGTPQPPARQVKPLASAMDNNIVTAAIRIISEESGVAVEDFTGETVFAEIGIDSLSSMVISSRFREELNLGLDSTFSLFDEVPTISKLGEFLSGESSTSNSDTGSCNLDTDSSRSSESDDTRPLDLQPYCRPSTSVIVQGLPRVAKKTLFMLPDGGGSASSYVTIPRLKSDVAIVGLNCPYARDPENMHCTHGAMIESFCTEIRRRQPKGPYHLGGWSSGGAFAYVTAETLVNQGEEVHSLIIIDAPVPQVMEKLPVSFYDYCNTVGLFANQPGGGNDGKSAPPSYLIPHFVAVVDVMLDYKVASLKTARMPTVGLIWAADTVMEEGKAPKMKGMHFMVQKRKDFGPDGWDTILPGADFDIVKADGANHFTLMVSLTHSFALIVVISGC